MQRRDERLVECPHNEGVHYYVWHCNEQNRLGLRPCVDCKAPDRAKSLTEVCLDGNGGRDPKRK